MPLTGVLLLCCLTLRADEKDAAALLDGVNTIAAPGMPGSLSVYGERAFVVVAGKSGDSLEPVVAAAQAGTGANGGRVVAFGHNGYLDVANVRLVDTGRLLLNAIRWTSRGNGAGQVMVYRLGPLVAWLREQRLNVVEGDPDRAGSARVFIADAHDLNKAQAARLAAYVNNGGGLITAATGWGWEMVTKHKLATEFPATDLLAPLGLVFTNAGLEKTVPGGFSTAGAPPLLTHAGRAFEAIQASSAGAPHPLSAADAGQVSTTLGRAISALPPGDKMLLPALREFVRRPAAPVIPTHEHPIKKDDTAARLLLTLEINDDKTLAPADVRANPAAAVFPGAPPPDARPVPLTADIDLRTPGWHSLGLYAAPGALLTVEIPGNAANRNLAVRIGAHTDTLWNLDKWQRAPEITRVFPLKTASTQAANAFGGLVYIVVPDDAQPAVVPVKITGAVPAPLYVRGQTPFIAWRNTIRNAPGPWAELATDKVILTVPSKVVRNLDDPEPLLKYWDEGMDADADLATIPHARRRPERILTDEQISVGYMHNGYPIMTGLDVADYVVNLPRLMHGSWGHWHEMGHNHQSPDWTFDGTGEVTVNLFTLYVHEKVMGIPGTRASSATSPAWQQAAFKKYTDGGRKFEDWKKDPFLALYMYIQLQREFGWDAYKKVFAEYRALPDGQRPKSDDEKRDQWMVRFSKTVGRNLGPFFQAWGVPTSDQARASIASLPGWMPSDWPKT